MTLTCWRGLKIFQRVKKLKIIKRKKIKSIQHLLLLPFFKSLFEFANQGTEGGDMVKHCKLYFYTLKVHIRYLYTQKQVGNNHKTSFAEVFNNDLIFCFLYATKLLIAKQKKSFKNIFSQVLFNNH